MITQCILLAFFITITSSQAPPTVPIELKCFSDTEDLSDFQQRHICDMLYALAHALEKGDDETMPLYNWTEIKLPQLLFDKHIVSSIDLGRKFTLVLLELATIVGNRVDYVIHKIATVNMLVGPKGPPGLRGLQGIPGLKGDRGPQGLQGPQGPPGTPGIKGKNGPQGDRGPQGFTGRPGSQGPQGPPGFDGKPGPKGDTGPQGPQGPPGFDGKPGPKGDTGPKGDSGKSGSKGNTGKTGPKGDTGKPGKDGKDGVDGKPGKDGKDGLQGPQGPQGPPGPKLNATELETLLTESKGVVTIVVEDIMQKANNSDSLEKVVTDAVKLVTSNISLSSLSDDFKKDIDILVDNKTQALETSTTSKINDITFKYDGISSKILTLNEDIGSLKTLDTQKTNQIETMASEMNRTVNYFLDSFQTDVNNSIAEINSTLNDLQAASNWDVMKEEIFSTFDEKYEEKQVKFEEKLDTKLDDQLQLRLKPLESNITVFEEKLQLIPSTDEIRLQIIEGINENTEDITSKVKDDFFENQSWPFVSTKIKDAAREVYSEICPKPSHEFDEIPLQEDQDISNSPDDYIDDFTTPSYETSEMTSVARQLSFHPSLQPLFDHVCNKCPNITQIKSQLQLEVIESISNPCVVTDQFLLLDHKSFETLSYVLFIIYGVFIFIILLAMIIGMRTSRIKKLVFEAKDNDETHHALIKRFHQQTTD